MEAVASSDDMQDLHDGQGDENGEFGTNEDGFSFREVEIREQDRFLPVANIARIMKKVLPNNAKIAKDAKEGIQECVSEFISFITSEASDKCQQEKRKTINGDDLLWAMSTLGFEKYVEPLKLYLGKYRESVKGEKPEKKATIRQKEPVFTNSKGPLQTLHVGLMPCSMPVTSTMQGLNTSSSTHVGNVVSSSMAPGESLDSSGLPPLSEYGSFVHYDGQPQSLMMDENVVYLNPGKADALSEEKTSRDAPPSDHGFGATLHQPPHNYNLHNHPDSLQSQHVIPQNVDLSLYEPQSNVMQPFRFLVSPDDVATEGYVSATNASLSPNV